MIIARHSDAKHPYPNAPLRNAAEFLRKCYEFDEGAARKKDFYARVNRCSSFPPREDYLRSTSSLPYPSFAVFNGAGLTIKEAYFTQDGIPRTISISDDSKDLKIKAGGLITVNLRGEGRLVWMVRDEKRLLELKDFSLSKKQVYGLIASERKHFFEVVRLSGGKEHNMQECGFDFSGQMKTLYDSMALDWLQSLKQTSASFGKLFPDRVLVPLSYPFSIPLEVSPGCTMGCRMCHENGKKMKYTSLEDVKNHIREWSGSLGRLVPATQSVFLARNNLFFRPFDFIMETLQFMKSDEIVSSITKGARPQLLDFMGERISTWGNIAKFSAFATLQNLNDFSVCELSELFDNGLKHLFIAMETGSDSIRAGILGKNYTTEDVLEGTRKAFEAGMGVNMLLMLGAGGKSRMNEHAYETIEAMKSLIAIRDEVCKGKYSTPLIFYISVLDPSVAPKAMLKSIGALNPDPLSELHLMGTLKNNTNNHHLLSPVAGFDFMLDGTHPINIFPYSFRPSLI